MSLYYYDYYYGRYIVDNAISTAIACVIFPKLHSNPCHYYTTILIISIGNRIGDRTRMDSTIIYTYSYSSMDHGGS